MENKLYEQLMLSDGAELTEMQNEFCRIHKEVLAYATLAAQNVVKMSAALKEMRDKKAWTGVFESFEEYVETACGFKARQAYNYIKMYETLPENFLQSNAKLGVTKLLLLSELEDEERERFIEENNVESSTVAELRKLVDEKTKECEQLSLDIAGAKTRAKNAADRAEIKIQELQNKTDNAETAVARLKKEIEELKNAPAKTITVENKDTEAKMAALESELRAKESELNSVRKQLNIAQSTEMVTFKVKFDEWQRLGAELISIIGKLDSEKADKCRSAIKAVVGGLAQ